MKRISARATAVSIVATAVASAIALASALRGRDERARCGAGFVTRGARCLVPEGHPCPAPLVFTTHGCDAPDLELDVPATSILIGPSDWEAEGRVSARWARVDAFRVDAFEVTRGRWSVATTDADAARAASAMTRDEAAAFCASRGGRLPTEDEWMAAAASAASSPRRYPWGDTGAVCRRAAWGLADGPCARAGTGPDTVGAHPDGDSPWGLHDLAGNVAEWVAADARKPDIGVVKGGSWRSSLATDLRVWSRTELPPDARDTRVGVRCAYSEGASKAASRAPANADGDGGSPGVK
jgi:formylglycine-generating enzyme required for sulfatase activity